MAYYDDIPGNSVAESVWIHIDVFAPSSLDVSAASSPRSSLEESPSDMMRYAAIAELELRGWRGVDDEDMFEARIAQEIVRQRLIAAENERHEASKRALKKRISRGDTLGHKVSSKFTHLASEAARRIPKAAKAATSAVSKVPMAAFNTLYCARNLSETDHPRVNGYRCDLPLNM